MVRIVGPGRSLISLLGLRTLRKSLVVLRVVLVRFPFGPRKKGRQEFLVAKFLHSQIRSVNSRRPRGRTGSGGTRRGCRRSWHRIRRLFVTRFSAGKTCRPLLPMSRLSPIRLFRRSGRMKIGRMGRLLLRVPKIRRSQRKFMAVNRFVLLREFALLKWLLIFKNMK